MVGETGGGCDVRERRRRRPPDSRPPRSSLHVHRTGGVGRCDGGHLAVVDCGDGGGGHAAEADSVTSASLAPEIVTVVPPAVDPEAGPTDVTLGTPTTSALIAPPGRFQLVVGDLVLASARMGEERELGRRRRADGGRGGAPARDQSTANRSPAFSRERRGEGDQLNGPRWGGLRRPGSRARVVRSLRRAKNTQLVGEVPPPVCSFTRQRTITPSYGSLQQCRHACRERPLQLATAPRRSGGFPTSVAHAGRLHTTAGCALAVKLQTAEGASPTSCVFFAGRRLELHGPRNRAGRRPPPRRRQRDHPPTAAPGEGPAT